MSMKLSSRIALLACPINSQVTYQWGEVHHVDQQYEDDCVIIITYFISLKNHTHIRNMVYNIDIQY